MTGVRPSRSEPPVGAGGTPATNRASGRLPAERWNTVLVVLAVGLLLCRLPFIFQPALWIDEAFSLYHARTPLANLWGEGWRLESSPPLYYTLLWAWIRLVGDSEPAARLLSLLLTLATAWFVRRTAMTIGGPRAGALAMLAWALPAIGIEYTVEIRPYALLLLLIAVALSSFVSLVLHCTGPAGTGGQAAGATDALAAGRGALLRSLAVTVVATVATFYTHTTSASFIAGLAAAGLYIGIASRARAAYFAIWLAACAVVAVACLPQAMTATGVLDSNRRGLAWIPKTLDLFNLSDIARHWALGAVYWDSRISGPLSFYLFALMLFCGWRMRANPTLTGVGAVLVVVGTGFLLAAGLVQPVLMARTALWLWLPVSIVLGCCAASVDWRSAGWRLAAGGMAAICLVTSASYAYLRERQRPWHDTFVRLSERAQPNDRILVIDPEVACVLDHYATGVLRNLPRFRLELGPGQRFRSGQRLDIRCNRLGVVGAADVGTAGPRGDWIIVDAFLQRADLENLLKQAGGALQTLENVHVAGQAQAARVIRTTKP